MRLGTRQEEIYWRTIFPIAHRRDMELGDFAYLKTDALCGTISLASVEDILKMIPGMGGKLNGIEIDEKAMGRTKAIIQAMTPKERANPDILNASRRRRIARGSGTTIQDVNRLMNQFDASRKMMKQMTGGAFKKGKKRRGGFPFKF